jgi:hypothetical protein
MYNADKQRCMSGTPRRGTEFTKAFCTLQILHRIKVLYMCKCNRLIDSDEIYKPPTPLTAECLERNFTQIGN